MANPSPMLPMTLLRGTRTSLRMMSHVDDALMPILSSRRPSETPALLNGTTNADAEKYYKNIIKGSVSQILPVIPLCLSDLLMVAKTIAAFASYPEVTQALIPFNTKCSPSCCAVVDILATSDPASKD